MQPIFTMQYGEFAVVNELSDKIKNASVFVPASAQEKGIDLLLYRYDKERDRHSTVTVQVKMSRTYYPEGKRKQLKYPFSLWFNRFDIQDNADWYILVGIYALDPTKLDSRAKGKTWGKIMLAFTREEMKEFMTGVKQKKDPTKEDKMFGFGFDGNKKIFQTRGCAQERDMTQHLIENRLDEIEASFQ